MSLTRRARSFTGMVEFIKATVERVWPVSIAGAIMPAYREAGCANGYGILEAPSFIMKLVKDVIE